MARIELTPILFVVLKAGAIPLRLRSDHSLMCNTGMPSAFVALKAMSRPPVRYAAPMTASATSAIA